MASLCHKSMQSIVKWIHIRDGFSYLLFVLAVQTRGQRVLETNNNNYYLNSVRTQFLCRFVYDMNRASRSTLRVYQIGSGDKRRRQKTKP